MLNVGSSDSSGFLAYCTLHAWISKSMPIAENIKLQVPECKGLLAKEPGLADDLIYDSCSLGALKIKVTLLKV